MCESLPFYSSVHDQLYTSIYVHDQRNGVMTTYVTNDQHEHKISDELSLFTPQR